MSFTFEKNRGGVDSSTESSFDSSPPSHAPGLLDSVASRVGMGLLQRKIQRRAMQRRAADDARAALDVHEAASRGTAGAAGPLPHLDAIQRSFGAHDVSGVRAHTDAAAGHASESIGAEAYAVGNDVAFRGTPSLHTAAHEAAHVVQQRAGVHLSGGVGQVGDEHEQHADAVADRVVQGRSAEDLLDARAGGGARSAGGSGAVQLESSYDGLMPAHETWKDNYDYKGGKSDEFTYHHIIPENKLKLVTKELKAIKAHFEGLDETEENAESRKKGATLDGETKDLIAEAKKGWLETRVKNMAHAINRKYDGYGISVTEEQVKNTIKNDVALDKLFESFRTLMKEKLQPGFQQDFAKACLPLRRLIVDAVNETPFYNAVNASNTSSVVDRLWPDLDQKVFDKAAVTAAVERAIESLRNDQKKGPLNKGKISSKLESEIRSWDFEAYFREKCKPLSENSTSSDMHLKKLVQENATPHGEDDHLEHAVQWNAGNIHRGPSSSKRLNPKAGEAFNELLDDGGDVFEKAAVNVVSTDHFEALVKLNEKVDQLTANPVTKKNPPSDEKVTLATDVVKRMKTLMGFGLTKFDARQWNQVGQTDNMRLVKNEERVRAAQDKNLL